MKAAVVREVGKIAVEERDRPQPGPGEVLVRVAATGVCHTDVTASIDYVRVNVSWSLNGASTTHSVYLSGFGLDQQIPSDATITSVVSSASCASRLASAHSAWARGRESTSRAACSAS